MSVIHHHIVLCILLWASYTMHLCVCWVLQLDQIQWTDDCTKQGQAFPQTILWSVKRECLAVCCVRNSFKKWVLLAGMSHGVLYNSIVNNFPTGSCQHWLYYYIVHVKEGWGRGLRIGSAKTAEKAHWRGRVNRELPHRDHSWDHNWTGSVGSSLRWQFKVYHFLSFGSLDLIWCSSKASNEI